MDYELDTTRYYENGHHTLIAILTGLPIEDIIAACPAAEYWNGQTYVKVFHKLGFNTTKRFEKFEPDSDKPGIMRTTSYQKGYWYGFVYYKGWVYQGNTCWTLEEWKNMYKRLKITSMLKVWI